MKNQLPNVEMEKVIPSDPQYIKEPSGWNFKKLAYIPLVILLFIEWFSSLLSNVFEVIANKLEEICVVLEKFTNPNATKPDSSPDAAGSNKEN